MTEILLEHGMPIANTAALHIAAYAERLDTMRLLMDQGAELNEVISDCNNWTPMHLAAWKGGVDAMKLLEERGARSDLVDTDGKTPAQVLKDSKAAAQ
ncbi:hypothetical protein PMIN06_004404 [Paraphaeosphaeria minitans]